MNEQLEQPIFNHKAEKLPDAVGLTPEQFKAVAETALDTTMEVARLLGPEGRAKSEAVELIYKKLIGSCPSFKEAAVFVFAAISVMASAVAEFIERR